VGSNDLSLRVILSAQDAASGKLKGFGSTLINLAGDAGPLLKIFGGISLAAIGLGVAAVQAAAPFQQAMLALTAHAGLAQAQFHKVSTAVLNMAGDVGQAPTALAQALYPILSGFSGIQDQAAKTKVSLEELRLAAESTAGTTAKVTDVSRAASAAFNAYGMASNNTATNLKHMNNLFDVMNQTITEGNMQWTAYANKIGDLAAKASQSGIKFTEANAALAVFTNTGESVQLAGTHLGALFQTMSLDVDALAKRADKLTASHVHYAYVLKDVHGLMVKVKVAVKDTSNAFDIHAFKAMDLAHKLAYLEKITGGDAGKIKAILGNKALTATYLKLIQHSKDYQNALNDLNHAHGATASAFAKANAGFTQAMNRAKAAVDALFIRLGTALLPILTKLVSFVAPAVNWLINFARAASQNEVFMALLKGALIAFAGVALGILIPAFIGWAIAAGGAAIATLAATWPLLLVILIVTLVIAAIILLWTHWKQVSQWIGDRLGELGNWFHDQFAKIGAFFSALGTKLHEKIQLVIAFFDGLRSGIGQKIQAVLQFFRDLPGRIGSFLASLPQKALQWGEDLIMGFLNGIKNAAGKLWQGIQNIGSGIKKFLGFSKPEAGPLSTADQWMPDMMHLMTQGIIAGNPKLQAAVHQTATVMAAGMAPSGQRSGYAGVPYGRPPAGNSYSSSSVSGGNHYGDIIIHAAPGMNIQQLADEIERRRDRKFRSSGLMGNPARGMRNS
jgi:TP901 family phage tail tape measure protein